jgi:hypothetical protein
MDPNHCKAGMKNCAFRFHGGETTNDVHNSSHFIFDAERAHPTGSLDEGVKKINHPQRS